MQHIRYNALIALALVLAMAACGSTPTAAAPGAVTATLAASPGSTALTNGCATQHIPVDPLPPAQIIATQQNGGSATPIALSVGESVEIHLSAEMSWHMNLADPTQILTATAVEGWYNSALPACVWRYSATKAGSATLTFTGSALCQPGQVCPQYAIAAEFVVTVK